MTSERRCDECGEPIGVPSVNASVAGGRFCRDCVREVLRIKSEEIDQPCTRCGAENPRNISIKGVCIDCRETHGDELSDYLNQRRHGSIR